MNLSHIQSKCLLFMEKHKYSSFDCFDALTNPFIEKLSNGYPLIRRVFIQINALSPIDLHFLGMKKMIHTKTISDLLWYYSISDNYDKYDKVNYFFLSLNNLKSPNGYGWGLNFPYTSRFIDADENMPNLYNTVNSGIAICQSYSILTNENKKIAISLIHNILSSLDDVFGFVNEQTKGWYLYYPTQKQPTYNVNALTLYFFASLKAQFPELLINYEDKISKIVNLLISEQNSDGSWYYSRSEKGKWVDGFHSAFIIESLAFAFVNGLILKEHLIPIERALKFYIEYMFTSDGYPKYFKHSNRFPIEAQNIAQAIQTLSTVSVWLNKDFSNLLEKLVNNLVNQLYDDSGYFYYKITKFWKFKTPYFRWSLTPNILALEYYKKFKKI